MHSPSTQKQRRLMSKGSCLIGGLIIMAIIFYAAIVMSRRPPIFDIQIHILQNNIDIGAFFYTDIE